MALCQKPAEADSRPTAGCPWDVKKCPEICAMQLKMKTMSLADLESSVPATSHGLKMAQESPLSV